MLLGLKENNLETLVKKRSSVIYDKEHSTEIKTSIVNKVHDVQEMFKTLKKNIMNIESITKDLTNSATELIQEARKDNLSVSLKAKVNELEKLNKGLLIELKTINEKSHKAYFDSLNKISDRNHINSLKRSTESNTLETGLKKVILNDEATKHTKENIEKLSEAYYCITQFLTSMHELQIEVARGNNYKMGICRNNFELEKTKLKQLVKELKVFAIIKGPANKRSHHVRYRSNIIPTNILNVSSSTPIKEPKSGNDLMLKKRTSESGIQVKEKAKQIEFLRKLVENGLKKMEEDVVENLSNLNSKLDTQYQKLDLFLPNLEKYRKVTKDKKDEEVKRYMREIDELSNELQHKIKLNKEHENKIEELNKHQDDYNKTNEIVKRLKKEIDEKDEALGRFEKMTEKWVSFLDMKEREATFKSNEVTKEAMKKLEEKVKQLENQLKGKDELIQELREELKAKSSVSSKEEKEKKDSVEINTEQIKGALS